MSMRIVKEHGGDIKVRKGGEGGAVFQVLLPARLEREPRQTDE